MAFWDKWFGKKKDDLDVPSGSRPMTEDEMGLPELKGQNIPPPGRGPGGPGQASSFEQQGQGRQRQPRSLGPESGSRPSPPSTMGGPSPQSFPQSGQQRQAQDQDRRDQSRDMELVLSKLDNIRSMLSTLNMRIARLERAAGITEERREEPSYKW